MRVLIVNGFSNTPGGRDAAEKWIKAVKKAFSLQTHFNLSQIDFDIVDRTRLDLYLYQYASPFLEKDSQKRFDRIDFVLIDGDCTILPWSQSAFKFLILI
jgi:hypothetical protein